MSDDTLGEEQDLLDASRSSGGQRHYPDSAVARVRLIQQLYAAGPPSRTVRQVLPCVDSGEVTPALLEQSAAERDRIDQQITGPLSVRERLDDVIVAAKNPAPDCSRAH
ncbi:MerR family transcriptional regulator [Streptomyces sp. SAI-090]|uniref:MerR family transcriptional regulator n=1 Tax=unclassified Streptomyces TaxID=2593676 RepID=UPI0032AEC2FF